MPEWILDQDVGRQHHQRHGGERYEEIASIEMRVMALIGLSSSLAKNAKRAARSHPPANSAVVRRSARSSELLLDFALDRAGVLRKLVALRLGEEGVEAAAMLDRAKRVGRNAQAHRALAACRRAA